MGAKSLACGEGGVLLLDDRECYERAIAFAHYTRHRELTDPKLAATARAPFSQQSLSSCVVGFV